MKLFAVLAARELQVSKVWSNHRETFRHNELISCKLIILIFDQTKTRQTWAPAEIFPEGGKTTDTLKS